MRYFLLVSLFFSVLSGEAQKKKALDFPLGEKIKFKINYGWFTLGEASMQLADSLIKVDGNTYYHSHIEAKTVGLFSWLAGIENVYWGYVNTRNFRPLISEKHLDERSGKVDQWNSFDYQKMETQVTVINKEKDPPKEHFTVKLKEDTYDLHGTYMYLRSKLWSGYDVGDSLLLNAYWDKDLYDFGMEYGGMERVKYNGNKYNTHKFYGLFPVSSTFPKEKAVTVYVLERNGMGIPLLIEADMKIGKVKCELKSYEINGETIDF